jgi:hypothetical protein
VPGELSRKIIASQEALKLIKKTNPKALDTRNGWAQTNYSVTKWEVHLLIRNQSILIKVTTSTSIETFVKCKENSPDLI